MMLNEQRRWWGGLLAAVFLALPASHAWACSYPPADHADSSLLDTPVVFHGRVLTTRSSAAGEGQRQDVTFQLQERLKGSLASPVVARGYTFLNSCGGRPVPQDFEGIIFANREGDGVLRISRFLHAGTGPGYETLDRLRQERDAADASVAANSGQIGPLLSRARVLRRWRDHEEALITLRAIVGLAPQSTEALAGIAQVLIAQNKPREALVVLDEAEARLGPHPELSAARGVAGLVLGQRENLRQLDLRGADLSRLDLSRRDLRGVDFSGALLTWVDLQHSDLRGARFAGTRFERVRMEHANLEGATFTAPIGFPRVAGADLSRARLDRVVVPFPEFRLIDVNLEGATVVESRFGFVEFQRTRLRGASFTTVYFLRGSMSETDFAGATLRDVTFGPIRVGGQSIQAPDLRGARLINVRFP